MKPVIAALAIAVTTVTVGTLATALADAQRPERILRIFGDDSCPENEICVRAPETERYRDPLREDAPAQPDAVLRQKRLVTDLDSASRAQAIDSCTPVGAGGQTGCNRQRADQAREEKRQQGKPANIEF